MKDYTDIIDSPVITEKSAIKMQNDNVYTFKVAKDADKTQIKKVTHSFQDFHPAIHSPHLLHGF